VRCRFLLTTGILEDPLIWVLANTAVGRIVV